QAEEPRPVAAIRQAAPEYGAPARRARADADGEPSPRRAPPRRRFDDDDDAYRPRRRPPGGGGVGPLLRGSGAPLRVAAFAVAAFPWPGFLRSKDQPPTEAGARDDKKPRASNVEALLKFVPSESKLLVAIDLATLPNRNGFDRLLAKLPEDMMRELP